MTDKKTHTLDVPGAVLTYDVRGATTPTDEPPLLLIGLPMGAEGFTTVRSVKWPAKVVKPSAPIGRPNSSSGGSSVGVAASRTS